MFFILGGTKEYYSVGPDPGRIWVYLDEDTAVYNQQNVRYQAINLDGSATKETERTCPRWLLYPQTCKNRKNVLYMTAREDDNESRSLDLYFKHPSDFKPAFLDVTVFWENVYRDTAYSDMKKATQHRTFKFEMRAPFGWRPELANPEEMGGRVVHRLRLDSTS
jgi:hypothetical protein